MNGNQCQYGLVTTQNGLTMLARKSTGFMTNSPCIVNQMDKQCPNKSGWQIHKHIALEGNRTKQAQVYPKELCQAIRVGLQLQLQADKDGQFLLANIGDPSKETSEELKKTANELKMRYKTVEEENDQELEEAWDYVSGAQLDPKVVRGARQEEVEYIHKMNLYSKVPIKECYNKTNKGPISVRWIDINKGDADRPNYRSRLVAREINTHKRDDFFVATPPLEALKLLLSMVASGNEGELVMINNVGRAVFHAKATRDVFVQLPPEDQLLGEEQFCGKLNFSIYGTRDAAMNWQAECSQLLIDNGFSQGVATPCVFHRKEKGIRTLVHGDDYVSVGRLEQLEWMKKCWKGNTNSKLRPWDQGRMMSNN